MSLTAHIFATKCILFLFNDRIKLKKLKGSKERIIQIGKDDVLQSISTYIETFRSKLENTDYLLVNRLNKRLFEQSVRNMSNKYVNLAGIQMHITPHMFKYSFATLLLEADVDILYIQKMLRHRSINTTQIYTSISTHKQKEILENKHPINWIKI